MSKKKSTSFKGDIQTWTQRHDQRAPEDWLHLVLDGTYSLAAMRAAVLADRVPRKGRSKSPFSGDVHAWSERHDQYDPATWLYLVLDGTYSVPEMRAAILADNTPRKAT